MRSRTMSSRCRRWTDRRGPRKRRRAATSLDPAHLAGAERLEGDDGMGVLDAGNDLDLLVDEVADVGVVIDIELHQEIVIARGGLDLRGDLGFDERVGDGRTLTLAPQ